MREPRRLSRLPQQAHLAIDCCLSEVLRTLTYRDFAWILHQEILIQIVSLLFLTASLKVIIDDAPVEDALGCKLFLNSSLSLSEHLPVL